MSIYNADCSFLLNSTVSEWCPAIHVLPLEEADVINFLDAHPDILVTYLKARAPLAESLLEEFLPDRAPKKAAADIAPAEEPAPPNPRQEDLEELFPGIQFAPELFMNDFGGAGVGVNVNEQQSGVNVNEQQPVNINEQQLKFNVNHQQPGVNEQQHQAIVLSDDDDDDDDEDNDAEQYQEHADAEEQESIAHSIESSDEEPNEGYDVESEEDEDDTNGSSDNKSVSEYAEDSNNDSVKELVEEEDDGANEHSDNESDNGTEAQRETGKKHGNALQAGPESGASRANDKSRVSPALSPSARLTPDSPVLSPVRSPPARPLTSSLLPAPRKRPAPARSAGRTPRRYAPSSNPPSPTTSPEDNETEFLPFPAPAELVSKSRKEPPGKKWRLFEEESCINHMIDIREEDVLTGEARFAEAQRRMLQIDGIDKPGKFAIKNFWNRVGRARSGFDERKNKNAPLATSQQKQPRKTSGTSSTSAQSATRKRKAPSSSTRNTKRRRTVKFESEDEDDDVDNYLDQSDDSEPVKARTRKRGRDDDDEDDWQPDEATINALQKGLRAPKRARYTF